MCILGFETGIEKNRDEIGKFEKPDMPHVVFLYYNTTGHEIITEMGKERKI